MKKIRVTSKQYKSISFAYRIGGFTLTLGLLVGFSILIGKPIEFCLIFIPYFVTKSLYPKQFHATSLKNCFILSLLIFGLLTTISLPIEQSITFALLLGLIAPYLSHKAGVIQFKLKDYSYIEPRYNKLVEFYEEATKPRPFNVDNCTKDELIARCKELHFSEENINLAIMFFIDKTKQSEIAGNLYIDEKSITQQKWRMKKKLNKQ